LERNSVFTRVFARKLREGGRHLADLMEDVKEEVAALAARVPHKQFPAYYNETQGGRIFLGGLSRPDDAKPSDAELREQERQRRRLEERQRKAQEEERERRLQEEERRRLAALQPTASEMQRPIDELYSAWRRLDLSGYLAQWASDGVKIDLKARKRSSIKELA